MNRLLACLSALVLFAPLLGAAPATAEPATAEPDPADWPAVLAEAEGQTVYWHAWGGDQRINAYIEWAGDEVSARFGIEVVHVKLADTAEAVSRVLAEKAAGTTAGGAVDLIWINGENFAAMKENDLLFGPWAEALPHWRYVDVEGKPTVVNDFTVPTDGLEAPWGMAQIVFYHDTAVTPEPPRSMAALLDWARENPGRFAYPEPPNFLGTTFLKQALYGLIEDPSVLTAPVEEAAYAVTVAPLWAYLDALTPNLWREGRAYPQNGARLRQLLADGEIEVAFSFNPGEASAAIANYELPETVRSYILEGGTIGNTSFVAIPFNASATAGALVLADFLLSPEAQARKQDPAHWGNGTVLDIAALAEADRARFDAIDLGPASLRPEELVPVLPEPHPSWMVRIERDWTERYGVGQ
ncbi:MAG: ABC transporter substrate-binding protein [Pseudomonadota bacterium]